MSLIGTWLPILSASNLRVNTVPKFWIPIYAFREGSCTGTNAGQLLPQLERAIATELKSLVDSGSSRTTSLTLNGAIIKNSSTPNESCMLCVSSSQYEFLPFADFMKWCSIE
uniref:Uncharacterized protein n=1 Tax=Arundo donax TaxID=35708 RepID=A0A0A9FRW5_ARUDO